MCNMTKTRCNPASRIALYNHKRIKLALTKGRCTMPVAVDRPGNPQDACIRFVGTVRDGSHDCIPKAILLLALKKSKCELVTDKKLEAFNKA